MRNEHDWAVELMENVEDHECYVALTKDIRRIQEEAWKAGAKDHDNLLKDLKAVTASEQRLQSEKCALIKERDDLVGKLLQAKMDQSRLGSASH